MEVVNGLKMLTAQDAVAIVSSRDRVFFQGAAMTPSLLINALCERYKELQNVEIIQIHTQGEAKYTQSPYTQAFHLTSCFVGDNVRRGVDECTGDYIPIFLSEIHLLFKRNILPIDVAFIQVSPPDNNGFCSLGTSVDITLSAINSAKKVIALVNPQVPRTHGDGIIHINTITYGVTINTPIYTAQPKEPTKLENAIGEHIAALVEDGATLQMGIGSIPNAVLKNLTNHKSLGIHTEMFSDGILNLVKNGNITGEEKFIDIGKIVTSFAIGSHDLYQFIDDNPLVQFREAAYTNDTAIIRQNPKVTAINSAVEIDLTGQVCADSIGTYQYSGVGGQMDFIRGASLSENGKPIIALPSTTKSGISKITSFLQKGASVTTTRAHVHYVVTEYGVVNIFGKSLEQRARLLIDIAHPNHRERLEKEARERFRWK